MVIMKKQKKRKIGDDIMGVYYPCVYCGRIYANIRLVFGIQIRIVLQGISAKGTPDSNLCVLCYLDKKHEPDMKKKWDQIRFQGNSKENLKTVTKDILSRLREERNKELECIKKGIEYEVPD